MALPIIADGRPYYHRNREYVLQTIGTWPVLANRVELGL
jgi:hypothetical protein